MERVIQHYSNAQRARNASVKQGDSVFWITYSKRESIAGTGIFAEKGSIRGTARAIDVDKDTVQTWLKKAGEHFEKISEYLCRDLKMSQVQIDELWTYVKKKIKT